MKRIKNSDDISTNENIKVHSYTIFDKLFIVPTDGRHPLSI